MESARTEPPIIPLKHPLPVAVQACFWIAAILAGLFAIGIITNPVSGLVEAVGFSLVAWGIRKGQAGAAAAASCFLVLSAVLLMLRLPEDTSGREAVKVTVTILMMVGFILAGLFFRAAIELNRRQGGSEYRAGWIAVIALCSLFLITTRTYAVPTGSMENTLLTGDRILVETVAYPLGKSPANGNLIAMHYPIDRKQTFIKRIVGVPGDRIRIGHKRLFRNGVAVIEPYAVHKMDYEDSYRDNFPSSPDVPIVAPAREMLEKYVVNGELVIPQERYFVLGDNRDESLDSRYWGLVSRADIIGRPLLVYGSYSAGETQLPTVLTTRWNRLLKPL